MADSYIRRGQYQNNGGVFYQILRNLLLGEDHPLHNRTLHISGTFKMAEKPDIEDEKVDIEIKNRTLRKRSNRKLQVTFARRFLVWRFSDVQM